MTHHHHRAGAHPVPTIPPSFLRFSLPRRIALVAALLALMWAALLWAMG
jgi:hypothetical protein